VPPYGSPLRRDHYARTVAHPTVRVDGEDQRECSGEVIRFETGETTRAVATAADAFPGVRLRRELVMTAGYLLDVVTARVESGAERTVTLGLRPGGRLDVAARPDGSWRTRWRAGRRPLHGLHVASVPAVMAAVPGRGPSDDPGAAVVVADWSARAVNVVMVSVYWPGAPGQIAAVEPLPAGDTCPAAVRVHFDDGTHTEHSLERS
jgi:hypothetical protein